jgi:HAD superfamily hydrolase (TIGR01484 family)
MVQMTFTPRISRPRGLFITDLDGTLLDGQRRISVVHWSALADLRQQGFVVAAATGRSIHSWDLLLERLGLAAEDVRKLLDYVIVSTGAGILETLNGRLLRTLHLELDQVEAAVSLLDRLKLDYMVHRAIPDTAQFLYCQHSNDNPDFSRRLQLYSTYATPISQNHLQEYGAVTQILVIVPGLTGHEMAARLAELLPLCSVIKATSPLDGESMWIEIFHRQVSKSGAAAWLAAHCGIARAEVCAVGNDYNDEDLLAWAGRAYVVANAPEVLRRRFPTVAANEHGGVAEAAARWLA